MSSTRFCRTDDADVHVIRRRRSGNVDLQRVREETVIGCANHYVARAWAAMNDAGTVVESCCGLLYEVGSSRPSTKIRIAGVNLSPATSSLKSAVRAYTFDGRNRRQQYRRRWCRRRRRWRLQPSSRAVEAARSKQICFAWLREHCMKRAGNQSR